MPQESRVFRSFDAEPVFEASGVENRRSISHAAQTVRRPITFGRNAIERPVRLFVARIAGPASRRCSAVTPRWNTAMQPSRMSGTSMPSRTFLRTAAVAALLSAVTTLCVHLLPELWAHLSTFDERVALRNDPIYMGRFGIVIVHCVLVLVSMAGLGATLWRRASILVGFGLLGYLVFALAEILRMSLAIFALNRTWREQYATAADEAVRAGLRTLINGFDGVSAALFFVFSLGFTAGLVCYAAVLVRGTSRERQLGAVFATWAALSSATLADTTAGTTVFSSGLWWVGPYFQPLARAYIAWWLWTSSVSASRH
jgi:hypothetical protein